MIQIENQMINPDLAVCARKIQGMWKIWMAHYPAPVFIELLPLEISAVLVSVDGSEWMINPSLLSVATMNANRCLLYFNGLDPINSVSVPPSFTVPERRKKK
jgi:hypothetical protein